MNFYIFTSIIFIINFIINKHSDINEIRNIINNIKSSIDNINKKIENNNFTNDKIIYDKFNKFFKVNINPIERYN
jgi:hypothetical protein